MKIMTIRVILQMEMELVVKVFMGTSLRMNPLALSMTAKVFYPWPMQEKTQMDRSSLLQLFELIGWR